MATIVILEHALQRHVELPYMAHLFAERWRERGHRVLVHYGAEDPPPGDVAILNVDLTVTPPEYRALVPRYPRVVNGRVFDISKSRYSQDLVRPDSDWQGPVIIKTETNYGGKPEQLLRSIGARTGAAAAIPAGPVADGYPIYVSLRAVPEAVWRVPGLIVEKFLPEREARGYCVRVWTFFGDRERNVLWIAPDPIVKASNVTVREPVPLPDEARAWRARLGFDFGKFDYVKQGGRWVLLDANRTPSAPTERGGPIAAAIRELGDGIDAFLR